MKYYLWFLLFICSCGERQTDTTAVVATDTTTQSAGPAGDEPAANFDYEYAGTINNKLNVAFQLHHIAGKVSGVYQYTRKGIDIPLTGTLSGKHLLLYELGQANDTVAVIDATLINDSIKGTWQKPGELAYQVLLKQSGKTLADIPDNIAGTYVSESEVNCNLVIKILKAANAYRYELQTSKRKLGGRLSFVRTEEEGNLYLNFLDLPRDVLEGEGAKGKEATGNQPHSLEALFSDGEIDIQNTGNAMNTYNKLPECDAKFLHLVKKP